MKNKYKIGVVGCGNVGVAVSADLSIEGHEVSIIKTSNTNEGVFQKIKNNSNRVFLKENGTYKKTTIHRLTHDMSEITGKDIIFVTIQSKYHEQLIREMSQYLTSNQIVIVICSYMSSFYFKKYCHSLPIIVEATGPYLEGRIEEEDIENEIVFRVGCRLTRSPLSIFQEDKADECMEKIKHAYKGFSNDYSVIESALLNPNMVLHTIGSVMSIPRIEYSQGVFCMYREAYSRKNNATIQIMLKLDEEKQNVLKKLDCRPIDIFKAGGFLGDPMESFYSYSESSDRAISPTSIKSRYITEDVPQGLVLLESIAKEIGVDVPVATSLINLSEVALGCNFRESGRTIQKLNAVDYIKQYARL